MTHEHRANHWRVALKILLFVTTPLWFPVFFVGMLAFALVSGICKVIYEEVWTPISEMVDGIDD